VRYACPGHNAAACMHSNNTGHTALKKEEFTALRTPGCLLGFLDVFAHGKDSIDSPMWKISRKIKTQKKYVM
jgi:hypothetical protein